MYFLEKVNTALQNLENHKVLLKDPVRPNEGPWLVMDPVWGSSCVPWVPWYDFWCLECKNMAYIADFHLWAIWLPRMIKDSETPVWLGLKHILRSLIFPWNTLEAPLKLDWTAFEKSLNYPLYFYEILLIHPQNTLQSSLWHSTNFHVTTASLKIP